jgi:hypothetical protein
MAKLTREHVVAAGLVGTVVVVVGFASGLGLRQPSTNTTVQAQPHHAAPGPQDTQTSGEQTAPPPPPIAGGGSGGAGNPLPQPIQMTKPAETQFSQQTPTSATTTSSSTITSTSPSLPPCDPGLVRQLTDTVDGTVGGLTGLLGLPTKPLTPLLDPLLGTGCPPPSTTSTTPSATP